MGRGIRRLVLERLPGPALLPVALRRPAAGVVALCLTVTAVIAVSVFHQSRAGWLDATVDARIKAGLGGHPLSFDLGGHSLLTVVSGFGDLVPVTMMTVALAVACLVTRRWRAAVLAGVAVLVSGAVTEVVLKPLTGRLLNGSLSFPSGHATLMFTLAAICAVLLAGPSRPRVPAVLRLSLALAVVLAAGAVSTAMVDRGAHYFTDIIGGAAPGVATVLLTALMLDRFIPAPDSGDGRHQPGRPGRPDGTMRLASYESGIDP
jgi:membrane-associated phospholipid phosphatase